MKELTIEQKAQRYDEAIEGIQEILSSGQDSIKMSRLQLRLQGIFPELKEGEDEKIRKAIIEGLRAMKGNFHTISSVKIDDAIAWLEKQAEHVEINPTEFDIRLQTLIGKFSSLPKEELASSLSFWLNVVQNDVTYKDEEKQGGQKFNIGDEIKTANEEPLTITKIDEKGYWSEDLFICSFDDSAKWELVKQKSAWSEEDEYLQAFIIELLYGIEDTNDKEYEKKCRKAADWLKSLKDRVQLQPKQEWSEENMFKVQRICKYLDEAKKYYADITEVRDCIDWLKSIKPQNRWKPTKEQLDALLYVLRYYTPKVTDKIGWDSIKILELMYHELEKL